MRATVLLLAACSRSALVFDVPLGVDASGDVGLTDTVDANEASGSCRAPVAQRIAVLPKESSTGVPRTSTVPSMLVAGEWIYFTYGDSVARVSKCGGPVQVLWNGEAPLAGIATDAVSVFFIDGFFPRVRAFKLGGSSADTLASFVQGGPATNLVLDGSALFFAQDGLVETLPVTGGSPSTMGLGKGFIAVDASRVFAWRGDDLVAIDRTTLAVTVLMTARNGSHIAVDDESVFVTGGEDAHDGYVRSVPKSGGPTSSLAEGLGASRAIVADATTVYFAVVVTPRFWSTPTNIVSIPKKGGAASTLSTATGPTAPIAVDETSIYWLNEWGAEAGIMKLDK